LPSIPDYNRICRRINRLNIKIFDNDNKSSLHDDYFVIAIDSTGVKVTNRGEWIKRETFQLLRVPMTEHEFFNTYHFKACNQQSR